MSVTESEAVGAIDIQLSACGWRLDPRKTARNVFKQQARTREQNESLKGKKPDYVLYADDDSDKPTVVIEAKRPGKSMQQALMQGRAYAERLDAPLVVATDGWRVKTFHRRLNAPLLIDGREADELFGPEMARQFVVRNDFSSFSERAAIGQDELVAKFKRANDLLKNEGLSAGIERFSEFANFMFLKLQIEGGGELAGFSWADIETRRGVALNKLVMHIFAELKREHSELFEQTGIKNPKNMERLIDILSSFRLSSVRDDIKGMAFEHFIHSYTRGTKNDLGQYFTPRHIVRMMVHFLKPKIGEKVYDPFCGTGGMLIECFRYISQHIESPQDKRKLKQETLFGRDNSNVARIAMMNMIMFGDGHSNIQRGDSYASIAETRHKYDIVLTNIPFSQKTDFSEGYPVAPVGQKNGDSIGVQHCLESLKKTGNARAAVIVPIGFLYKDELAHERRHILDNWNLERVVELSPKCFQPYTEQQTAVMVIDRNRKRGSFSYYRVKNDGYSQDGYRVPLPGGNDIDKAMDDDGAASNPADTQGAARFKRLNLIVRKNEWKLGDVAAVTAGAGNISPKTKIADVRDGVHPVMMVADLARKHIDYHLAESQYKLTDKAVAEKKPHLFATHTTLIPVTGKASLKNHRALLAAPAHATSTLAGIEAHPDRLHPFCIFHFFLNFDIENITYDLGYPGISRNTLVKVGIPNYTDKQQREIIGRIAKCVELSGELSARHEENIIAR
ncbi:MAG: N-6 DNA methylase [Gammaproteobacteria bacterium]|nr:N-6 DNA methylase [Gammaproteobacteria bacterium]